MFRITFPGRVAIGGLRFQSFDANLDPPQVALSVFTKPRDARNRDDGMVSGELHTFWFRIPSQDILDKFGTAGQAVEDEEDIWVEEVSADESRNNASTGASTVRISVESQTDEVEKEESELVKGTNDAEAWRLGLDELRKAIAERDGMTYDTRAGLLAMMDRVYGPRVFGDLVEHDFVEEEPVEMGSEQDLPGPMPVDLESGLMDPIPLAPVEEQRELPEDRLLPEKPIEPLGEGETQPSNSEQADDGGAPVPEDGRDPSGWSGPLPLAIRERERESKTDNPGMDGDGDEYGEFHGR
jgi:hypothetical protein